jgi:hypothetical protein
VKDLQEAAQKNGEEYTYYPNEFKLVFNFSRMFTEKNAKKVMDNIIESYKNDFIEKYSQVETIENLLSSSDVEEYDYKELSELIEKQIISTESYLADKIESSQNYRSKKLGYSYYDMLQTLNIINKMILEFLNLILKGITYQKTQKLNNFI